ncbi:TetR family transcriptional regulator [Agromyces sp. CFH 90414]|uniref:TetR family transcriptional regulator n=1 Tax=Agromyces agglutinans TaxID=2662258 RepID=A0A6I2F0A0_9MICO|nr:TetR/AcrR family transcriptional regulator [Agromyces agglutinans]MRG58825.1 TetR family transcriptional regulator [Agromyces agglutinans]
MSRPPAARDAVLDAFERLIGSSGERAATLEATAREAGVSKGGLLYHFGSRQALIAGLVERLHRLVEEDVERIHDAPDGAISYFVRSSVDLETPLDRTFVAAVRLAQGGDRAAATAIDEVRERWLAALGRDIGDPSLALAVTLIGDGLYYHAALRAEATEGADADVAAIAPAQMDDLVSLLERIARGEASPGPAAGGEASGD